MIRNYFKVAIRSLIRNKAFTFINVFGFQTFGSIAPPIGPELVNSFPEGEEMIEAFLNHHKQNQKEYEHL